MKSLIMIKQQYKILSGYNLNELFEQLGFASGLHTSQWKSLTMNLSDWDKHVIMQPFLSHETKYAMSLISDSGEVVDTPFGILLNYPKLLADWRQALEAYLSEVGEIPFFGS